MVPGVAFRSRLWPSCRCPRFIGQAAALIVCLTAVGSPAAAQDGQAPDLNKAPAKLVLFRIEAQPLALALEAYSAASQVQVIYNGNLAVGRHSAALAGDLNAAEALRILLQGTGLAARYMAEDAVVLELRAETDRQTGTVANPLAARYYGLIQTRLMQRLCADEVVLQGTSRLAASFWIDAEGRVVRAALLDTTGDRARDISIAQVIGRVSVGAPPPRHFAQPITLVLSPRSESFQHECQDIRAEVPSRTAP
jgi:hypothetical protein